MPAKADSTTQPSSQPQSGAPSAGQSASQSTPAERDPDDHMNPRMPPADPSSPAENQQNEQAAKQARAAADQQTLAKLQGIYVDVHKVTVDGAMFPWEGTCLRCGFHTLELTQDAAKAIVNAHIAIHWRDAVSGIAMQGGAGLVGVPTADLRLEAMQAQEKGAQKGGQDALKPVQQKEQQQQQKVTQLAEQLSGSAASSSTQPQTHGG